nr:DNA-3-methyladenine glycosylase 2 family protein [Actinomycetota bacterium]
LDLDADPQAVSAVLDDDPVIGPLVRSRPGLRVPGHVDGAELAVRAVLGQQISVGRARALATGLAEEHGEALEQPSSGVVRLFPSAERLAAIDPRRLPMPRARGHALVRMCQALADGGLALDRSADRGQVRAALLAVPGIGPWTADYIAMRALGDPDVLLETDVGVRRACAALGVETGDLARVAQRWRPWRSYALMHLWDYEAKERP